MSISACSSPGGDALATAYTRSERECAARQKDGVFALPLPPDKNAAAQQSEMKDAEGLEPGFELHL